jgi:predicted nuclease with TOPRIM domain
MHAEIADLKKENETNKGNQEQARKRVGKLEQDNATLHNKIVDLPSDIDVRQSTVL